MKTFQKILSVVAGLLMLGVSSGAAEKGQAPSSPGGFDLAFKGGTPQQLVKEMRDAVARQFTEPDKVFPINVVVPKELEDVEVPPMTLQSVDPDAVFRTLNVLWANAGMQWTGAGGKVWVLVAAPDRRKAKAFYVGDLLRKLKIEDITTAVKTTWELGGDVGRRKPELKFHKDTDLMIALAHEQQLATMEEVLVQLRVEWAPPKRVN